MEKHNNSPGLLGVLVAVVVAVSAFGFIDLGSKYAAEVVAHQQHPKHAVANIETLIAATSCLWALAVFTGYFVVCMHMPINKKGEC